MQNTDTPWVYSSGLSGEGRIAIDLTLRPGVVLPQCDAAAHVDGRLDDPCWQDVRPIPFQNSPFSMLGAATDFRMFRDADNVYFAYRCRSSADASAGARGDNPPAAGPDDALEIYVADAGRGEGIHCIIPRHGEATATFGTVATGRKTDPRWEGRWHSGVQQTPHGWTAEVALPIETLTEARIALGRLQLNAMARSRTPSGAEVVFLTDPRYGTKFRSCVGFLRVVGDPADPPEPRSFTVRLHFGEIDDVEPGRRVFDVAVQGETVLEALDVAREAGASNRALVKEIRHVDASDRIVIELTPHGPPSPGNAAPTISGVELAQEQ